jgi:phosphotransferase system enzyme I (PtsP)
MLNFLRAIVQEVNTARDMKSALAIIVVRVKEVMKTEVCSVYLRDAKGDYVLMATDGLNQDAVGRVRLGSGEGLVGRVVAREEPINLEQAEAHPSYQYFPETGEERYSAFLGVPIIHQRKVLGVLVVQQVEQRRFDEGEEAFLVTMSAQLAGVIAHAEATGGVVPSGAKPAQARFIGIPGASGIAIGEAVVIAPPADLHAVPQQPCKDVDAEVAFFKRCLTAVRNDIKALGERLRERVSKEEQALFDAYLAMLDDASLATEVVSRIQAGNSAAYAWSQIILEHENIFHSMNDPYLRERATDLRDLGRRVLAYLQESEQKERVYPDKTILIGEELTASMLGEVPKEKLAGLVSVLGSGNSHVAILARAMDIPTVMGAVDLPFTQVDGRSVIVDGYKGAIYLDPNAQARKHYKAIYLEEQALVKGLEALKSLPCETLDKHRLPLYVNTGLLADVVRSLERGAEGVGLYRTEVPFLLRERFPSEEEQRLIYREQLEAFAPHAVTMRTLDIGGDKALPYFPIEEDNPFLGWRGIRVSLDHPELFLAQVRAMIKASEGLDNLRILLPMITNMQEVEAARGLIRRVYEELISEGYKLRRPQVGAMIEVPAAVYLAPELARRVDFLSVGSNDLTQYLLAVDRNNARVADLYEAFHPAVLRALQHIVHSAHDAGISVSICGELAGDPGAAIILMAMGFDILSMNAANLPKVKSVIRGVTLAQAQSLLAEVMRMTDGRLIQARIERELRDTGLNRLIRPAASEGAATH